MTGLLNFFENIASVLRRRYTIIEWLIPGASEFVRDIAPSELGNFGLNNESVALSTYLREVIPLKPMAQNIITEFKDFKRVRRGDVRCVWFDTENGLVPKFLRL